MKLKTMLMALAFIMFMVSRGAATTFDIDFVGNGWLDVWFEGHDVSWGSIDSTTSSDLGIRDDSLQMDGDFVLCWEWVDLFTVDRIVVVAHGTAEFDQSHELGSYGTSVESNCGIGVLWSRRVSTDANTSDAFSTGAVADSNFIISQYASNVDPFTSVEVTQRNLADDGLGSCDLGFSEMLVSWWSDNLSSDLSNSLSDHLLDPIDLSFDWAEWNGSSRIHLTTDYEFSLDILSLWQTPAIELEIVSYLSG